MNNDPYCDIKKYHLATHFNKNGGAKPACRKTAVNLKKELWTFRHEAVTCRKCLIFIYDQLIEKRFIGGLDEKINEQTSKRDFKQSSK